MVRRSRARPPVLSSSGCLLTVLTARLQRDPSRARYASTARCVATERSAALPERPPGAHPNALLALQFAGPRATLTASRGHVKSSQVIEECVRQSVVYFRVRCYFRDKTYFRVVLCSFSCWAREPCAPNQAPCIPSRGASKNEGYLTVLKCPQDTPNTSENGRSTVE